MRALRSALTAMVLAPLLAVSSAWGGGSASAAATAPDQWLSEYAGGQNTSTNAGEQVIGSATAAQLKQSWQVADTGTFVAPAIVNGVVYQAVNTGSAAPGSFVAWSAKTGQQLWSTLLPVNGDYYRGQTVAGNIALLPFEGFHELGGITAVDLTTHQVLWSRSRPPSTVDPGNDDGTGGPIVADSGRVYLIAGNNQLSAYDLQTGALLWHLEPSIAIRGIAAAGGRLYTGDYPNIAGAGLTTYDGATGAKLWTSPGLQGIPVVVGSTLLVPTDGGVAAVAAAGCGQAVCPRLWSANITDAYSESILIGAADQNTFYATASLVDRTGRLMRFSTVTGTRQQTINLAESSNEIPIRVANTVWLMANADEIIGWSATGTSSTPLKRLYLPTDSVTGGLADANGSLVIDVWGSGLFGFRVPGT